MKLVLLDTIIYISLAGKGGSAAGIYYDNFGIPQVPGHKFCVFEVHQHKIRRHNY